MSEAHASVLLNEVLAALNPRSGQTIMWIGRTAWPWT
jgi:hypothetical protein